MNKLNRRDFIKTSSCLAISGTIPATRVPSLFKTSATTYPEPILNIKKHIADPVIIKSIDVIKSENEIFIVTTADSGQKGITTANFRMEFFFPVLKDMLVPFFLNKDARDIEAILDNLLHQRTIYKYSGIPLFNPLGHIEISIMDLLGKVAGMSSGNFFGKKIRTQIPMYVSSLTRETSPEEEVDNLQRQLTETGCKAVKIKIGGRMSRNKDAAPGRTEKLVPLARKKLGDKVTIYVDANSSYDAQEGIKVANMLEDHGVAIFEEPCYWEDYAANKKVADSLKKMKLAGGEQDTSYLRFRDIIENKIYHVVQPDLYYNGGLLRAHYVARLAESHKMTIAPHSPKADPLAAPFFQFASVAPNLEGFQEYPHGNKNFPGWYGPHFTIKDGLVEVPSGPGLGLQYDESIFRKI